MKHNYQDLIHIFAEQFSLTDNTRLVKGDDEPIYLPADERYSYHRIIFAHGFYASAFHEISHWCIAGKNRRLLEDFGYWYAPDGRDAKQQENFEQVEIKPQAIEWAFCIASGFNFNVSADNLSGIEVDRFGFQCKVFEQVINYLEYGFPKSAKLFIDALIAFYQPGLILNAEMFEFNNPLHFTNTTETVLMEGVI
ncbi:elongation factor P hydroxylase [Thalassotalea psychrophila]|uniref:Elongation factor P hydroxylase n=1 Tax=Thalassotalea psychrophila TaxID=3065647 RepID=A0ABY9TY36_9GAMM|nr:elongation factor P hydroxylase [Colwelliaceae bacterium SQ149]